jgi:hypothetical protein
MERARPSGNEEADEDQYDGDATEHFRAKWSGAEKVPTRCHDQDGGND